MGKCVNFYQGKNCDGKNGEVLNESEHDKSIYLVEVNYKENLSLWHSYFDNLGIKIALNVSCTIHNYCDYNDDKLFHKIP